MSKAWPHIPIGSIAKPIERLETPQSGIPYRQIGVRLWGQGAYERESIDGSETKYKTLNRVKAGDIIVNKIWARNGSVSVVSNQLEGCYCSGEFPIFEPILTQLDPQWFYWITKTRWFWDKCDAHSRGTSGKNRIRPEKFMAIPIPLPPLAEQQRIVAKIERLAGKIEEAKKYHLESEEKIDALLSSKLNTFLEAASKSLIPKKTIGSFTVYDRYGPRFYNQPYSDNGSLIIRATDIDENGKIDFHTMPRLSVSNEEIAKLKLLPGDLIIVRSGSIGLSAVFNDINLECIPSAYLIQFRFDRFVDPYYVRYCLQAPQLKKQLTGRGTSVKNLNANKIKNTEIPLPPLKDQQRIVAELDSLQTKIDHLKVIQAQTATELDAMLPSILDQAFKGEL